MVDEVVHGIHELAPGYEIRDMIGALIDFKQWGVWRDKAKNGFFYTSTRSKRQPVFLCCSEDGGECLLLIDGEEKVQHPNLFCGKYVVQDVEYIVYKEDKDSKLIVLPYVTDLEDLDVPE
jgi:hypothetical protein